MSMAPKGSRAIAVVGHFIFSLAHFSAAGIAIESAMLHAAHVALRDLRF
jgi:hypothetical protein